MPDFGDFIFPLTNAEFFVKFLFFLGNAVEFLFVIGNKITTTMASAVKPSVRKNPVPLTSETTPAINNPAMVITVKYKITYAPQSFLLSLFSSPSAV